MAGVISSVRTQLTRRGKMLFALIDDGTAQLEVAMFSEVFDQHQSRLREDQLLIVQGKVSNDEYSGGMRIVADQICDLQLAREARARALRIRLNGNADAAKLKSMLDPFRASTHGVEGTPVEVFYTTDSASCTVRLGEQWRVRLPDELLEKLTTWTSRDSVSVAY